MASSSGGGPRISGRSPRQRDRQAVQRVQRAVVLLDDRDEPQHAAWLLLALVEPELRRTGTLHPEAQAQARAAAKLFAKGGLLRAATEVWLAAEAQHHASQALWQAGQDALGNRISGQHGRTPLGEPIAGLSLLGRQVSAGHRASFDDGLHQALRRLEALADPHAVLALYDGLGLRSQAAERAQALGLGTAAAPRLLASGRPFEAARLWARDGDHQQALDALYLVSRDSLSYRAACVLAAECAVELDVLRFELDHLVGPFCASRPQSSKEIDALRELAGLYRRHDRLHTAREIIEGLYASEPQLDDLREELNTLTRMMGQGGAEAGDPKPPTGQAARSVGPDSLLDDFELPSLPDLPELTPLPRPLPPQGLPPRRPAPQGPTVAVGANSGTPPLGVTLAPVGASDDTPEESAGSRPTMDFFDEDQAPVEPERAPRPVGPGALVAGRYRVEDLLGQGGMGAVYRAYDQELSEPVALKILSAPTRSEAALARFRQELRLARKLTHRNIVRVHDLGIHAGQRFITMELLQGADMRAHMDSRSLPRREAIDLMGQAAAGLQAAHDMGVVHRDVKPENLFVTLELVVKVMDFGIARTVMAAGMTMEGAVGGTATYMAPEQANNFSSVDARADQYGLGVVAYELLAGKPPFQHEALVPLLHMHATEPPPSLLEIDPSIPEPVEEVIFKALAKDPSDRFEDCIDFGRALVQAWETPYHVLRT